MSTVRIRVIVKAIEDVLAGKTVVVLSGRGIGWRDVRRGGPRRRQWSDYQFIDVDVINRCWEKKNANQLVAPRETARKCERRERRLNNRFDGPSIDLFFLTTG